MKFYDILKRLHLYLFLFLSSELSFGGQMSSAIQSNVRRVIVITGVSYGVIFFTRMPRHLRWATALYLLLTVILIGTSYEKYGVALGSLQYMSLSLSFTVAYGGFMGAWFLRDVSIKEITTVILILFAINQLVIGRIFTHQFNSTDRSTSAEETYYLTLVFCFYLISFLQDNKARNLNVAIFMMLLIIGFFHRTIWVVTAMSLGLIVYLMRDAVRRKLPRISVLALPYVLVAVIGVSLLVAAKPTIIDNLLSSADDIQNSDSQGTSGWRHDQRMLYWERILDRPFFGWMYDGYDDGELTAVIENNQNWIDVKGTFIHSGYIHVLYHYGLFGFLLMYGLVLNTLIFMRRRWRSDPGYVALFVFLCTGWVLSWSYQLPIFYWVLLGVGSYMACLVPVEKMENRIIRRHSDVSGPVAVA